MGARQGKTNEAHELRISTNPGQMAGKPVIRSTRIPVELIVRMLAQGVAEDEILREYPRLQPQDIRAALTYAANVLAGETVFPIMAEPHVLGTGI